MLRLRTALREFFPAALEAFGDLAAPELLVRRRTGERGPADPGAGHRGGAPARRRKPEEKAAEIIAVLRTEQPGPPSAVAADYVVRVRFLAKMVTAINAEIATMEEQVRSCFGQARDAKIYLSRPTLGKILAARILGEFGDDPGRYVSAKARKNHAGASPVTRASGKMKPVLARLVCNDRLVDALHQQAFWADRILRGRPYYDQPRARG